MDIDKLIEEARPGNFTVSTVLDNLQAGDEVRIELQSGNQLDGTVKFKNSKTLTLDVPDFGFWACRVDMIAGVGIPGKGEPCPKCHKKASQYEDGNDTRYYECSFCGHLWSIPLTDEGEGRAVPAQGWKCGGCGVVIYSLNQPRCEECKRLMKKWKEEDKNLGETQYLADEEALVRQKKAIDDDPEASDVPDEAKFEKTEEELEAGRTI